MSFTSETLNSPTGAALRLRVAAPADKPRGIIQIHHGLAEHSARYERFANVLTARGFAACAHDHRGHGYTTAPDAPPGVFAPSGGWDKVIEDALAVEDTLRARFPGVPLIVLGHSMGGVIAMNHAMARSGEIEGLAIWNANLALGGRAGLMRAVMAVENLFKTSIAPSTWMDALTFQAFSSGIKNARTRSDWLSQIPEEVDAYINDPLCGNPASIALWRDIVDGSERGADEHRLRAVRRDLPIHMAAGGQDPATDRGKAMKTLAARLYNARFTDATMRFDPKARHETLNEIGYEDAMADFADWAERVCG